LARCKSTTVFLIDDDDSVRRALGRLIQSAGHKVRPFASAREFLDSGTHDDGPACLVLDVRMPGLNGLDLQRELQAAKTFLPIIFITGYGDVPTSVKAMKAGAVDFIPKPVRDEDLLQSIAQAMARAERESADRIEIETVRARANRLTPREREIMARVVRGFLNKQIAFDLGVVEKTVKVHRARVMQKMQVESLAELVRLAEKIAPPPARAV